MKVYTGKEVFEKALLHGSENNEELNELSEIIKSKSYELVELNIQQQIERDVDLAEFVENNTEYLSKIRKVNNPIILGSISRGGPQIDNVVIDGFHRFTQAFYNKEKSIMAYVPIKPQNNMKVVKSLMGKEFEITEGFKVSYPKKALLDQTQLIEKYLRSEKFGEESETKDYLDRIKLFSKRSFVTKIYYVEKDKIGRIDFADFGMIFQYHAFKNKKREWLPFAEKMKLKTFGELAYDFKYTPENIEILKIEMLKNGFDVVVFEKENEGQTTAKAQAQRIRVLALKFKYDDSINLRAIKDYILQNSYFEYENTEDGTLIFKTKKNGTKGEENLNGRDYKEAMAIREKLNQKFGQIKVKIEIIDEWVYLTAEISHLKEDEANYFFSKIVDGESRFIEIMTSVILVEKKFGHLFDLDWQGIRDNLKATNTYPEVDQFGNHYSTAIKLNLIQKDKNGAEYFLQKRKKQSGLSGKSNFEALESAAFFIDSDGDFCISESGLNLFLAERFGVKSDLNIRNLRFITVSILDLGENISPSKFKEIEKYFSGLEKRFEISTFVDTNKYQITIDSVLDIGLYN
jgi:hypothetical protein